MVCPPNQVTGTPCLSLPCMLLLVSSATALEPDREIVYFWVVRKTLQNEWLSLYRDRDIDANLGYLHMEEFIQVLNSRDLGLQLNEDELLYIAEQTDINLNGWIPLVQILPQLPPLLLAIYNQRAEQAMVRETHWIHSHGDIIIM